MVAVMDGGNFPVCRLMYSLVIEQDVGCVKT